jgi:hypothetical protein
VKGFVDDRLTKPKKESLMPLHFGSNGHGESPGKIAVTQIGDDCSLFHPFEGNPPEEEFLAASMTNVLIKWMEDRKATVRHALPIVRNGNTTYLFVWHDPLGS